MRTPSARSARTRGVADLVLRQPRDVLAVEAELRQADGDVRLAAAEGGDELRRLQKPLEPRRAQRSMISPKVTTLGI